MKVLTLCPADSSGLRGRAFWSTRPARRRNRQHASRPSSARAGHPLQPASSEQNTQNFRAHDDDVRDRQVMRHVFQGRRSV
jgi:hypothetical protein